MKEPAMECACFAVMTTMRNLNMLISRRDLFWTRLWSGSHLCCGISPLLLLPPPDHHHRRRGLRTIRAWSPRCVGCVAASACGMRCTTNSPPPTTVPLHALTFCTRSVVITCCPLHFRLVSSIGFIRRVFVCDSSRGTHLSSEQWPLGHVCQLDSIHRRDAVQSERHCIMNN
jgi:hypothetical protein